MWFRSLAVGYFKLLIETNKLQEVFDSLFFWNFFTFFWDLFFTLKISPVFVSSSSLNGSLYRLFLVLGWVGVSV
jgi:hypothetical protein